ncbi:hypothetical protein T440DRAFT_434307 [Plenodomus tracheiphilus IPT5]|uniref:Ams2/SPT21 N-terminal domain-containing protein n=1 Tax=Plenodomus tracheiphilus IPT5 TaxID=1408161 RepID=A0A6A7AR79_9PLEO|nr:hypothetical protein T440DRAFT_434307 [Plenodomus tracheiphilus IPT5]
MSTPSHSAMDSGAVQHATPPAAAPDDDHMADVPRRPMRVKVLYTFDDQNKSNCLARLPNALNVPVVSLDENTQVGVIELKTCIQAIVGASPELVAKLGHDYTVYAYDFSEYETPLVGQGMLSWILASASTTPNAPAEDSQTMVTGRVCKNILGIFSNGIKETLEVRLKLVPVPTCMQKEYVENMERYHSLSQLMPAGFDYSQWSDFLKENPTLGHLAQPTPTYHTQHAQQNPFGGVEPFHQMLTRNSPSQETSRNDSFYDQPNMSINNQPTRPSSPAMSTISFHHYQYNPDSRPASRASVRSEAAPPPQQFPYSDPYVIEEQDDGPPKKRARITQAKRPRNTPLNTHNDSLRVTASTAASVRLHRPTLGNASASAELVPRAPTPRPGDRVFAQRGQRRPPAPSALRHPSMDAGRPYMSPYDTSAFSDNAIDSPDERDESPGDTPTEMPSSPPLAANQTVSPAPSSPNLPTMSAPADSGFVSDMAMGREEENAGSGSKLGTTEDRVGPRQNKVRRPWQHVNPGPVEHLPQSYVPRPKQPYRKHPVQPIAESIEQDMSMTGMDLDTITQNMFDPAQFQKQFPRDKSGGYAHGPASQQGYNHTGERLAPTDSFPFGMVKHNQSQETLRFTSAKVESPDSASHVSPTGESEAVIYSRSATPNLPTKLTKTAKPRGLPRSHTWSGAEPMSDAAAPADPNAPRSGSGAKRRKYIKDRLEKAIAAGEMPQHCVNCGEIDTPTWRKAYTRVELGTPEGLQLSTDTAGTEVIAYEAIDTSDDTDGEPKYRIFKNNLTREEKTMNIFEPLNLCNPCGLWLMKKAAMRPKTVWDKSSKPAKRKRATASGSRTKSMSQVDDLASDAVVPESDSAMPGDQDEPVAPFDGTSGRHMRPPPAFERAASMQTTGGSDLEAAQAALRRAIQSSPAGVRGSQKSPINIDPDLTPRPTRRLLFQSPRKDGEAKSLASNSALPLQAANAPADDDAPKKPRCRRCKGLKKACDRERPCRRCDDAGIGRDGCIPCEQPRTHWFEQPVARPMMNEEENPDKENCPPIHSQRSRNDDDFADLFEDPVSPKTTPQKNTLFQDLLKTPTPGSRRRGLLTPKRGTDDMDLLTTPSRNIFTPRGTRAATIAPETPFTRQLNALLSDHPISSPSNAIDFSNFPTFNTPGRPGAQFSDFLHDDFLSSDMPMPSSPPKGGPLGLGFDLYEDPETATNGIWGGAGMFGNEDLMANMGNGSDHASRHSSMEFNDGPDAATLLKMNVGGITVDFAAMIEEVVGAQQDGDDDADAKPALSPEASSRGLGLTPEGPAAE